MKNLRSWILVPLTLLYVACATSPEKAIGGRQSGFWEAKAQAKDLSNNKTYGLSLDITAMQPSSLRMDVTGTLGINVATLAIYKNEVRYNLYREKKYFQGPLSDHALRPLFRMNLNPRLLMNLCTDTPIEDRGWSCTTDAQGLVDSCSRASDGLKINWLDRDGDKKRVVVTDQHFELQILFKTYAELDQTKVQGPKNPFQIEPQKDFSRYKIP